MTVCPDNATPEGWPVWVDYFVGEEEYTQCIGCNYSIYVAAPVYVTGTVWEIVWKWMRAGYMGVPGNLTLTGVNVTLSDGTIYSNLSNATGGYNISVAPGNYTLNATLSPAFAPRQYGYVNLTGDEGVVVIDFVGNNGLLPDAPLYVGNQKISPIALSYALKAVNCYLYNQSYSAGNLNATNMGYVVAVWLGTTP